MSTGINRIQKKQISLEGKILILVEGEDERFFLMKALPLMSALAHLEDRVDIVSIGGRTPELLARTLAEQEKRSGFHQRAGLAVWMDAEQSATATLQVIQAALTSAHLPATISAGEWVGATPEGRVGVFISQKTGGHTGCFDDLLWESVCGKPEAQCIEQLITCAKTHSKARKETKSRVHAYLAIQDKPESHIGQSVSQTGVWDLEHAALQPVWKFLEQALPR